MKTFRIATAFFFLFLFACDGENIDIFLPEVETNQASGITTSEAKLNGTLTKLGSSAITAMGFEFSQDAVALANDNGERFEISINATSAPLDFDHTVTNLTSATEYHFRAFAETENGENFGEIFTFTTQ